MDEARTLHSALGLGTGEEVGDGERVRFVDADLVIVDEFSMVDISKRNTMLGERIRLYCKAYHTERNALPELQQAG